MLNIVKYELEYLIQLFESENIAKPLTAKKATTRIDLVKKECQRILRAMSEDIFNSDNQNIGSYIQNHQINLIEFSNRISLGRDLEEKNEEKPYFSQFQFYVTDLLMSFRELYPREFNHQKAIPSDLFKKIRQGLIDSMAEVIQYGQSLEVEQMINILLQVTEVDGAFLKFSQSDTLAVIQKKIIALFEASPAIKSNDLLGLFIEYNFNFPVFYHYCCGEIMARKDACENIADSFRELYLIRKELLQMIQNHGEAFYAESPDLLTSLINFVAAEIDYIKGLNALADDLAAIGSLDQSFKVSFTVKQLAFFIHLQVECGIILEEKPKKIHQYIVGHYSTRDTEKISENSFKNAYYSGNADDISKVTGKISEMLARAQEKY